MPHKPLNPCSTPGCSNLVAHGRCAEHEKQAEKQRGSADKRGYGTRWQRIRKAYLYRHPWCTLCGAMATVADHYPLSRRELVARGADPDAPSNLRPLCATCHNRETAQHQPGGWANEHRRGQ